MDARYTKLQYSGGNGNSNPANSLGGVRSNVNLVSRTGSLSSITGVVINDIIGMTGGNTCRFYYVNSGGNKTLQFEPYGKTVGAGVLFTADGSTVLLGGSGLATDGYALVTVTFANLPANSTTELVTTTPTTNGVFDDVTNAQTLSGHTDYRGLYFFNNSGSESLAHVAIYIAQSFAGPEQLYLALDAAGIGNGTSTGVMQTIGNETTAPTNVTWSQPTESSPLVLSGTIAPSNSFGFWLKRVVPINQPSTVVADSFLLGFKAYVVL